MRIYHFVTTSARFFPFIHTFQACACGKFGLIIVVFFFLFKSDFMEGGDTHKQITVWKMKVQIYSVPAALSPLALLP